MSDQSTKSLNLHEAVRCLSNDESTDLTRPENSMLEDNGYDSAIVPSRSFQEVESLQNTEETPLGRHIGSFGVIMMIVQRIIGSGIFAVPGTIFNDVGGSQFLFFLVWGAAGYMSFAGIFCFLELGSIVPRSGGMKVFLEYIYYKPRMMITVIFSLYSILFGFAISNSIIFGEYTLYALGVDDAESESAKHIGLLFVVIMCVVNGVSPHFGVRTQNVVGLIKLILLFIMALSGIWVLFAPQSVTGIKNNLHFHDFFTPRNKVTIGSFASALLKAVFSFDGWQTAHIVTNEIKDPIKTMNFAAPFALTIINICYFFINLSYLIVIPSDEFEKAHEMVGSMLMEKLFGYKIGRQLLTSTVAISAAGNIMTVLYHVSRMNQEIFREGFLPGSRFFASNHPFGAPMRCLIFPLFLSSAFLLAPTPKNVYSWVVNLEGFPSQLFVGLTCFGIFILRYRSKDDSETIYRTSLVHVAFVTLFALFVVIGSLLSFSNGKESTGLPNYAYCAMFMLFCCFLYWAFKFQILPRIGHYKLTPVKVRLSDGLTIKKWKKQYPIDDIQIE